MSKKQQMRLGGMRNDEPDASECVEGQPKRPIDVGIGNAELDKGRKLEMHRDGVCKV